MTSITITIDRNKGGITGGVVPLFLLVRGDSVLRDRQPIMTTFLIIENVVIIKNSV